MLLTIDQDRHFMLLAHELASQSTESGRRVGAIIVNSQGEIVSSGFNGLPQGIRDLPERHDRASGAKYFWSVHAEAKAIYDAARRGMTLAGCTLYVPWYPCVECAKAIIQSGIATLVAYPPDDTDARWSTQFAVAKQMLAESGVTVRLMDKLAELPSGIG